jgi:NTE family protein
MRAFGIFEGGGAKGLAHVGALRAAEDHGIQFIGVAGASAGAIVATLIAAGYCGDELFDAANPGDVSKIYSKSPLDFFAEDWNSFDTFVKAAKKVFNDPGLLGIAKLYCRHKRLFKRLGAQMGIFSTDAFETHLDELLRKKLPGVSSGRKPTFGEMPMPLKIVATDITRRQLLVFSQEHSPTYPVSKAVAASVNLPFVFKPQSVDLAGIKRPSSEWPHGLIGQTGTVSAVDGGLLSNFPAWLFDAERAQQGPHIPTFGFRLVDSSTITNNGSKSKSALANFMGSLLGTVLSGDPLLETREIENLHEIPLRVTTGTLEFDMEDRRKAGLFDEGYVHADDFFRTPGSPCNPVPINKGLGEALALFRHGTELTECHLRINVVIATTRGTLRVTYSFNMDNDTDDRLEFPAGSGASGVCWNTRLPVTCNLDDAKQTFNSEWRMSKYQQALVKPDLKALLCVPIFAPHLSDVEIQRKIIGVLNIDSTDDILTVLSDRRAIELAEEIAELVGGMMESSGTGVEDGSEK